YTAPGTCGASPDTVTATCKIGRASCRERVKTADASCNVQARPNASMTKTCSPDPVQVGGTITIGGTLTNTGNVGLNCTLRDSTGAAVSGCSGTLGPNQSCTYSGSYTAPGT